MNNILKYYDKYIEFWNTIYYKSNRQLGGINMFDSWFIFGNVEEGE